MEQLRLIPVLMLFIGVLFVYAGFKDKSPSEILRESLGNNANTTGGVYGPDVNPTYSGVTNAGVLAYQPPSNSLTVGTF